MPFTISASGKYVLGNNFVTGSAAQTAITINVSNVILDLNGFFVSGPGGVTNTQTAVISVGTVSNVTIRNGTIANNGYGIVVNSTSTNGINHLYENLNITRCLSVGIIFTGDTASTIVRSNTISQIGGFSGQASNGAGIACLAGVRIENNFVNSVAGASVGSGNVGTGIGTGPGSFTIGNTITNCNNGIVGGKYKDNLTFGCTTPFSGGTDATGNN